METIEHKTVGTCSRSISIKLDGDVVQEVRFIGGCTGNLQGVSRLVAGRSVSEVVAMLEGIRCQNGTSCPDQLSKALKAARPHGGNGGQAR
jgi:uncharacterized protein (TIGR03905 family)